MTHNDVSLGLLLSIYDCELFDLSSFPLSMVAILVQLVGFLVNNIGHIFIIILYFDVCTIGVVIYCEIYRPCGTL